MNQTLKNRRARLASEAAASAIGIGVIARNIVKICMNVAAKSLSMMMKAESVTSADCGYVTPALSGRRSRLTRKVLLIFRLNAGFAVMNAKIMNIPLTFAAEF